MRRRLAAVAAAIAITTTFCAAQNQAAEPPGPDPSDSPFSMPAVIVTGTNALRDEFLLGPNQQPEWTARRPWATTRVYVHPPWQTAFELGWDASFLRHGKPQHLLQEEIELGLPHRFQVDFENHDQNFREGEEADGWRHDSNSLELGYAFADWGRLLLNPTIKGEWKFNNGAADAWEVQLLLGEELAPELHWGLNLFFEHQIGDDRHQEIAVSQAASYTLIDQKLSAGVEMKFSSESDKDSRNDPENHLGIGPSFQWRPTRRTHLDVVPLFGIGHSSPQVELLVFFGFEFGPGSKGEGVVPASLRGK